MIVIFRFALLAIFTLGLAGCNDSWTWHQKITVSVTTPDGIKTASSVMKATLKEKGGWWAPPEATGATTSVYGEAVVLEVAPGKYLFALLKGTPLAYRVFYPDEAPLKVASRLESLRETRELTREQYPMLVTFGDINDPNSVRRIDPSDLSQVFGDSFELQAVTLSITVEPTTSGNMPMLPWLCSYKAKHLRLSGKSGPISDNELANNIGSGDFKNSDCE